MFIHAFKFLLLICLSVAMMGCDRFTSNSVAGICSDQPELCEDLQQISDCRFIRTAVIRARYHHKQMPDEKHLLDLLEELNTYQSCLELTLQIEYTRYKHRKQQRVDNFLVTKSSIEKLLQQANGTQDPNLAYYLWTAHQDLAAKKVFLSASNKPNLDDPILLHKLALYYSKADPQRALTFYYEALRQSQSMEYVPYNMFLQLTAFFYRHHFYHDAYIWAKVATSTTEDPTGINFDMIVEEGKISIDRQNKLTLISEEYISEIEAGDFERTTPILSTYHSR